MSIEMDLPVNEMQRVDWENLSRADAAAFGLQLSLYNDAYNEHQKAKVGTWTFAHALAASVIVAGALLLWQEPSNIVLLSVLLALVIGLGQRLWHLRQVKRDMRRTHIELVREVDRLRGEA